MRLTHAYTQLCLLIQFSTRLRQVQAGAAAFCVKYRSAAKLLCGGAGEGDAGPDRSLVICGIVADDAEQEIRLRGKDDAHVRAAQAEQIAGFMGALRAFRQALRDAVVHLLGKQVRKHLLRGLLRNALPVVDQP